MARRSEPGLFCLNAVNATQQVWSTLCYARYPRYPAMAVELLCTDGLPHACRATRRGGGGRPMAARGARAASAPPVVPVDCREVDQRQRLRHRRQHRVCCGPVSRNRGAVTETGLPDLRDAAQGHHPRPRGEQVGGKGRRRDTGALRRARRSVARRRCRSLRATRRRRRHSQTRKRKV
eukprot:365874-Chlamydomonas_euryale.AAC.1